MSELRTGVINISSGDAVHNIMGIGFNGYDDQGQARWDLISNVNILNIEVGIVMFKVVSTTRAEICLVSVSKEIFRRF